MCSNEHKSDKQLARRRDADPAIAAVFEELQTVLETQGLVGLQPSCRSTPTPSSSRRRLPESTLNESKCPMPAR
jgi:hypothetical protein